MNKRKINFVKALLRKASLFWWTRQVAVKKARVARGVYRCNSCGYEGKRKEFEIDHVVPVVDPVKGFVSFDEYINRLLPDSPSGWQVLCHSCHDKKTEKENKKRKKKND